MLTRMLEQVDVVYLVGFDGYASGGELHYYTERKMQLQVACCVGGGGVGRRSGEMEWEGGVGGGVLVT